MRQGHRRNDAEEGLSLSAENSNPEHRIALFQRKEIRRTLHNNEWWFALTDVIAARTDSVNPHGYLKDMRRRDPELSKGGGQIATPLGLIFDLAEISVGAP